MQFCPDQSCKEESMKILAQWLHLPLEINRAMLKEGYESYCDMMLIKPYSDPVH